MEGILIVYYSIMKNPPTLSASKQFLLIIFANSLDPDQARKMSSLIWIQTVWHTVHIPEIIFL